MEMFCVGTLFGVVFCLLCVLFCHLPKEDMKQLKNEQNESEHMTFFPAAGDWPYEKGSAEEKEALEITITDLYTMRMIAGLSRHEKEILDGIIAYAERELGDYEGAE